MAHNKYDIVVVGGGIHGVGVAQAAAAAGYTVALLEKKALAAGTSSKSSKLIHGGLRYLESYEFGLVRESLVERELLIDLAPDLVKRQKFFIPVYPQTSRRPWLIRIGLFAYAALAGFREHARFSTVPRAQWDDLDGLNTDSLQTVLQYWDAQTDDAALTRAVMASAIELGAELLCLARFTGAIVDSSTVEVAYIADGVEQTIDAKVLVNAAGPWAAGVNDLISPRPPSLKVDNVAGTHIELPGAVTQGCYYLEVPEDKRAVFVMPRGERTLLGTTEREYHGNPDDINAVDAAEKYLLKVYRQYFPGRQTEVLDRWAGLRVLPAASGEAFKRSRETQLPVDNTERPSVLSIYGGKLTGYRATAEKVMTILKRSLPDKKPVASTRELRLFPQ